MINLSRAVRKELRGSGVEISLISPVAVNTELGLGLAEPRQRQFRKIEPQQVADAIVETLRVPKFDVHVPKQLSISERAAALMPIGVQELALAPDPRRRRALAGRTPAPGGL